MKAYPIILFLLLVLSLACNLRAQNKAPEPDEVIQSVEEWLRENLDDSVLQALEQIDQDRVRELFEELRRRFQGTDLYDLGALKDTASRVLPLLQQFEETRPYAVWLQTHLDYLDTANELSREMGPNPPKPGALVPAPSPQLQRSVWNKQFEKRPLPPLAQTYVSRLKPIFSAERTPAELVWVAEVESSFDPKARSPAGAAGLFQLMPTTARTLGLSVRPPDERLQPEKSARAAAKYLRYLHGRFGDWRLALAAYNAGESRVDNLMKRHKARTFDAIAHRLPAETQMFVPKVEATLRKREGQALADLKLPKG
jgi:membrane-bound lytic murein transglycosylase D